MVAAVKLWPQPPMRPHVCIRCGCGSGQREYFIDLQFQLAEHYNPLMDGAVYICNACVPGLISDINSEVSVWNQAHAPWESPDRVEASFNWQEEIDLSGIEQELGRASENTPGDDQVTESDDQGIDEYLGHPEPADAVPEPTVSELSTDDESGSLAVARGFGIDFG